MADEKKRPWYRVKRIIGISLTTLGGGMTLIAPVTIFTLGPLSITTTYVGYILTAAGTYLTGYGMYDKRQRDKAEK